jgi:hypothetical protein
MHFMFFFFSFLRFRVWPGHRIDYRNFGFFKGLEFGIEKLNFEYPYNVCYKFQITFIFILENIRELKNITKVVQIEVLDTVTCFTATQRVHC